MDQGQYLSSSDSDDFNLTIDLDPKYSNGINISKEIIKAESDEDDNQINDDSLTIGCDEDEKSVNLYLITNKPKVAMPKLRRKFTKPRKMPMESEKNLNKSSPEQLWGILNCFACSFKTDKEDLLRKHLLESHAKDKNLCLYYGCPYKNNSKADLLKHAKFHTMGVGDFLCSRCTHRTTTQRKLFFHVKDKCKYRKSNEVKRYQCPLCPNSGSTYLALSNHFKTHAIENKSLKNIVQCPMCRVQTKITRFHNHAKHHLL